MSAFHAYDIRGIYNHDFNKTDVYKMGYFLPTLLNTNTILVGRDVRESSPEIFEYLCKGITDAGAHVHSIGLATTPMVYFATAQYGYKGSVQITASHNPREYNGLKVSGPGAMPIGFDTGLGQLKSMMETQPITPAQAPGTVTNIEMMADYLAFQQKYLTNLSGLNMVVDCSNGMACLLVKKLLGTQPVYLFDTLDGTFPNHEPNPLDQKNLVALKQAVTQQKADIGVIFDGDADRVMFVDENGRFVSPDLIIALMGHYFLKHQKGTVLHDIRTSKAVAEYLAPFGATVNMWKVGRAFAAPKLKAIDGVYGGELAGHYYFRDFFYSDSAMLAALVVLDVVNQFKQKGIGFSQIMAGIEKYANSGELNFKLERKQEAMDAVLNHFVAQQKPDAVYVFDGYRVEYPQWWFNIRKSNTEPYLRLLAEAKTTDLLDQKVTEIKKIIENFF